MRLPLVEIDVVAVEHNAQAIVELCSSAGITVTGVTKGVFGHPEVARAMLRGGVASIGESRLDNVARLRAGGVDAPVMLMRPPSLASVAEAVDAVAVSLQYDLVALERMGAAAVAAGGVHDVIVMVDLGERREGVLPDDLPRFARSAAALAGIRVVGIGTNLACFAGLIPTVENMNRLVELAELVEQGCGFELTWISAGSSSALPLLAEGAMPERVNHLRIGEAILLGRETVHHRPWPGTVQDAVLLRAEVVEVKDKPPAPPGPRADRTFMHAPSPDGGGGRRALVALGRADVDTDGLTPLDAGHRVLGAASDYLVVDVSRATAPVAVGDTVTYAVDYSALVTAMGSIGVGTHVVAGR
jgi:predicted amino acid racemase